MRKFTYPGQIESVTVESLRQFVDDFKNKKLTPFLKSEEIPADNSEALKVIVGKNFQTAVVDSDDDVLIEFYAPWCGHCKKLAPIWEQVANDLKDVPNLVIAKFDATVNEVDGLEIRGYPTLKFYPKGNKANPVDFNGGREVEDIKKWLQENSSAYKSYLDRQTEL